jgi:alpha-glucosidase
VFGGRAWEWNPRRGQYYLHNFLAEQPDLNFHNPAVQDAVLDVMRFWLERGVDGFRLDTVNYYFHDRQLRNNPPAKRPEHLPYAINPYDMQVHKYGKSQPENIGFLKRVRKLLNEFPGTTTVGEVGDSHVGLQLMGEYTSGGDKLHMAYTFDMLGNQFTAEHFRGKMQRFFDANPEGWPCWSFSNHDVDRHVTRWAEHARDRKALARQAAAMLIAFKGSICLYQGEELGLPQADILFEELTDPPGIRFWPEYKGRDGERTPIPWEAGAAPNGFTTGKPWLPVKSEHSALSVAAQESDPDSVLNFYREILAFRRQHPALIDGDISFVKTAEPILAFRRFDASERLVCVYNLSRETEQVTCDGEADILMSQSADRAGKKLALGPNGWAIFAEREGSPLRIDFKRRARPSN